MKYAYVRVSTIEQNMARQMEIMEKANIAMENVYSEKKSGKNMEREELQKLLSIARIGDSITVADISRLGRNMRDIVNVVYDLDKRGISIVSIKEGVDTSTELGRTFVMIAGIFAEMERNAIRERQMQGIAIAKREGRMKGRPKKSCPEFERVYMQYQNGSISLEQLLKLLDCSKSTYYWRIKQYEDDKTIKKEIIQFQKESEPYIDY